MAATVDRDTRTVSSDSISNRFSNPFPLFVCDNILQMENCVKRSFHMLFHHLMPQDTLKNGTLMAPYFQFHPEMTQKIIRNKPQLPKLQFRSVCNEFANAN